MWGVIANYKLMGHIMLHAGYRGRLIHSGKLYIDIMAIRRGVPNIINIINRIEYPFCPE